MAKLDKQKRRAKMVKIIALETEEGALRALSESVSSSVELKKLLL